MSASIETQDSLALDRERVTCLLVINTQLMKKAINIYHNVLSNPQSLNQLPQQARQTLIDSYQHCTRRIHCNLSVLSYIHEKYHGQGNHQASPNEASFPVINTAPPDMPELNPLYNKLQTLYADAIIKSRPQKVMGQSQFEQPASPYVRVGQFNPAVNNAQRTQDTPPMSNPATNNFENRAPNSQQQPQMFMNFNQQPMSNFPGSQLPAQSPQPPMTTMSPQQMFSTSDSPKDMNSTQRMLDLF